MTLYGLAAAGVVTLALLIALVLVLRHLEKLHLTDEQATALRSTLEALHAEEQETVRTLARTVEDHASKLVALGNRSR